MSYPTWLFDVVFEDGTVGEFFATGMDEEHAQQTLLCCAQTQGSDIERFNKAAQSSLAWHVLHYGEVTRITCKGTPDSVAENEI